MVKIGRDTLQRVAPLAATFVISWLLLGIGYANVLRKLDLLNLFVPTGMFYDQFLSQPGGLISWAACYLTQYFSHPWLGAAIYATMLTLTQWLVAKAFAIDRRWEPSAMMVPMMLLLGLVALGYEIFSMRTPGIAYTPLLGTMAVALAVWCSRLADRWHAAPAVAVASVLLYPWLGAYALIAGALCMAMYLARCRGTRHLAIGAGAALLVAALIWYAPVWWVRHADTTVSISHIYLSGLPALHAGEWRLWWPYAAAAAYLLVAALSTALRSNGEAQIGKVARYAPIALAAAAVVAVLICRNTDRNLRATIDLELALDDQDYGRALEIAQGIDCEPTRLNVMLGEIALNRLGLAADRMFALPNGCAPYDTQRSERALHDAGAIAVSYNLGRVNYAYRWAMEYMVEYGPRVEYLKYMVRCALLNGEVALAKKHLDVLSQTLYHRQWAQRYYPYLTDPEALWRDPEFAAIDQLAQFDDFVTKDYGIFERYLRPTLAQGDAPTMAALDLALQNCLVERQVTKFMQRLPQYAANRQQLPRHYQEAVVMYDNFNGTDMGTAYGVDPAVKQRFAQFVEANARYGSLPEDELLEQLRDAFGDTYWYYFILSKHFTLI